MTTLAYSHTLVAGQPENINDVQDMFNDVGTLVNGNLDTGNMATSMKAATLLGRYETISETSPVVVGPAFAVAGLYYTKPDGIQADGSASSGAAALIPVNPADYAVSGLTTQYRVQAMLVSNAVALGVNLTYGLYPIASALGSGALTLTLAAAVVGSTVTRNAPSASVQSFDASGDFALSSSAPYLLGVTFSGTPAANSRATLVMRLQAHNV